jgi:chloramphenicol 3-O-phosphotransferase
MIAVLVLMGAPGTGKSSVLDALSTLLELDGAEHAAIESEELTRGFPPLANSVLAEQLSAALTVQRRAGRRLFLVVFTAESDGDLDAVLQATSAERSLVVCLSAPAQLIAARLERREPDRWPGKAGLIARAREQASAVPALAGIDVTIETDGRNPEDVAHELLGAMRERRLL